MIALAIPVVFGTLLFIALGKNPAASLSIFFIAPLETVRGRSEVALKMIPLLLCSLGLAICYRSNVWNIGADVLLQNTDSPAVLQTAEKMGKFAFGWDSNMTAYGPKAYLGSSIINWAPYYKKAIKDVLDGAWKGETIRWGMKEGAIDTVALGDMVPADVKKMAEDKKAEIKDGKFNVWSGPMMGNDGKEVLAKDAKGDDKFISGIMFSVKGAEGKVPGNK